MDRAVSGGINGSGFISFEVEGAFEQNRISEEVCFFRRFFLSGKKGLNHLIGDVAFLWEKIDSEPKPLGIHFAGIGYILGDNDLKIKILPFFYFIRRFYQREVYHMLLLTRMKRILRPRHYFSSYTEKFRQHQITSKKYAMYARKPEQRHLIPIIQKCRLIL